MDDGGQKAVDRKALARALLDTLPLLARMIDAQMRDVTQQIAPPHFMMLKMLEQRTMTQSELAAVQHVGPSTMSATIEALSKRGWITRERSETDRRIIHVSITAEGRAMLTQFEDHVLNGVLLMLEPLGDDDLQALASSIEVMRRIFVSAMQRSQPDMLTDPFPFMPPPFPPPGFPPPGFPPPGFPPPGFFSREPTFPHDEPPSDDDALIDDPPVPPLV